MTGMWLALMVIATAFTIVGTIGYATGLTALALTVTALALGAAFLNAAFGLCLGCEIYLRLPLQLRSRQAPRSGAKTCPSRAG